MKALEEMRARAETATPPWGDPQPDLVEVTAKLFAALDAVMNLASSRRLIDSDQAVEEVTKALEGGAA